MIEFPFFNMQQLNLDWIIDKIKGMLSFLPDDGTVGQILRRTADGAEWSDEETGGGAVDSVNGMTGTVVLGADDIMMNNNESVEDSVSDLKSAITEQSEQIGELSPLNMFSTDYKYTASSGYQNVPITFSVAKYLATNLGTYSAQFRDSDNVTVSGVYVPGSATDYELNITSELASRIAYIRLYQGDVSIRLKNNIVTRVSALENQVEVDADVRAFDLRADRDARYEIDQRNVFAWKPFDKAYFSWMNDDGRSDMYQYKDLCDTYEIPYANAVPWEGIKANTTTVDGMTLVNYCKKVINEGGEIFAHGKTTITSSSTEEDFVKLFCDGKKIIEDALGSTINGIIQVGGSGYSSADFTECQKFSLAYFDYSDAYGTTPQYNITRTRLLRSNYDSDEAQVAAYKAVVDDAITNNKWVRFWCHGTDEVSITVLTSVFDYIATKVQNGDCAWASWKDMYDTFRSSTLENRIATLET